MPTLIERLHLRNFLSFGPESEPVELGPLNVLIGPNASGKSNFLEAFSLLQSTPGDLAQRIVEGGGISEWIWKGGSEVAVAEVEADVALAGSPNLGLRYLLSITMRGGYFEIRSERVRRLPEGKLLYESQYGIGDLFEGKGSPKGPGHHPLPVGTLESVLSQVKGPGAPPEIDSLGKLFSKIRLYRDWNLGRNAPAREAQLADLKTDFLAEDARNLVLVLAELQRRTETRQALAEHFRRFHPDFEEFVSSPVGGGRMQLFLREKGMREDLPATRLSDGTMRYLALLAVLCHPEPPPLVCIEEPELGLHPDIIPTIAELLVSASERTQLIVTTHSDILISALSDHPEAVVVCEKDSGGTTLERLQPEKLQKWLERYSLGDLWLKGTIGGTRW